MNKANEIPKTFEEALAQGWESPGAEGQYNENQTIDKGIAFLERDDEILCVPYVATYTYGKPYKKPERDA